MTPNPPNEATPGGIKRKWSWWRMVFPFKRRGSRGQLAGTTPARSLAAAATTTPQRKEFKPSVWLQSTWMTTAPVRELIASSIRDSC